MGANVTERNGTAASRAHAPNATRRHRARSPAVTSDRGLANDAFAPLPGPFIRSPSRPRVRSATRTVFDRSTVLYAYHGWRHAAAFRTSVSAPRGRGPHRSVLSVRRVPLVPELGRRRELPPQPRLPRPRVGADPV